MKRYNELTAADKAAIAERTEALRLAHRRLRFEIGSEIRLGHTRYFVLRDGERQRCRFHTLAGAEQWITDRTRNP